MPIVNRVADLHDEITAWRRDMHAHPELHYDVHRTAASVAEKLKSFGCDEVVPGIGRTGVVGVIRGRKARRQGGGAARRHGCAAARGGDRPAVQVDGARQDARLRPRRPHRDAAGSRQIPRRDAQFRRHRGGDLPAGGGGRRRRPGHGEGRPDHPFRHRGSLRHAQFSQACRSANSPSARVRSWRRPITLRSSSKAKAATRRGRI